MQINSVKKTWLIGLVGAATIFSTPIVTMAEFVNAPTPQDGVVTGNDVNVRVAPNRQIICTMKSGEKIKIIASDGEWLKIVIPADAKTYIASSMIENGKTKSNVNVRSGPGVEFPSYGILPRNSAVTVQPLPGKSDWSKINPPEGLYAYISANYVKFNDFTKSTSAGENIKDPAGQSGNNINVKTKTAADEDPSLRGSDLQINIRNRNAFEKLQDSFVPGTKLDVNVTGKFYRLKTPSHGLEYVIYITERGENKPYAYAYNNDVEAMRKIEAKSVKIKGERNNVRGWSLPVVAVSEIK